MKATTTTKSLRFWIDEPPERCRLLYGVSDELTDAYNAILEYWETDVRKVAVEATEAAIEAYHAWKDAPKETRGVLSTRAGDAGNAFTRSAFSVACSPRARGMRERPNRSSGSASGLSTRARDAGG